MISFSCPHPDCQKPLLWPDRDAGREVRCPRCGTALMVPAAAPQPRRRATRFLSLGVILTLAVLSLGWWVHRATRPAVVRQRFAAELDQLSPHWGGLQWEECDPARTCYRFGVYYTAEHGAYRFEVSRLHGDPTVVKVNPPNWLAFAAYAGGVQVDYLYRGGNETERKLLDFLTADLSDALGRATR